MHRIPFFQFSGSLPLKHGTTRKMVKYAILIYRIKKKIDNVITFMAILVKLIILQGATSYRTVERW